MPDEIRIESEDDYRGGKVFELLIMDCRNKCYICEDKESTGLNVEHRIPHKGDKTLKYNWDNLFLSCVHCNNTKSFCIDNTNDVIIDPVTLDPEEYIEIAISAVDGLKEKVIINKLKDAETVDTTVKLLNYVYNGAPTDIKRLESANLRNKIMREVNRFQLYVSGFKEETDLGYHELITKEISKRSAFAAFKRNIIRKDPDVVEKFSEELVTQHASTPK